MSGLAKLLTMAYVYIENEMRKAVKLKPRERILFNGRLIEVMALKHGSVLFRYVDQKGQFELSRIFINKWLGLR